MKLYTFFYYDCSHDFINGKQSEFSITASRFSVAFNAFCKFIEASSFYYFTFAQSYLVVTEKSVHRRIFSTKDYLTLYSLRRTPADG